MTVSVSVVTHNSADVVNALLDSLFTHTRGVDLQVFVVDNGSTDGTAERVKAAFPQVCVVEQDNLGFGAGHNAVLGRLQSDYHAIINPDITIAEDTLTTLAAYMEAHREVAICTPLVKNEDGTRQEVPCIDPKFRYLLAGKLEKYSRLFKKWRAEYVMRDCAFDRPTEILFCTGCFMFIRTALFLELGGFDERFFLYCEDADLSRRARAHGRAMCVTDAIATHGWERSSHHSGKLFRIHLRSIWLYFCKWRKG